MDLQEINRAVIAEVRATGKASGPFAASDMLVLHSRGARTGEERINPLAYLDHDGALVVELFSLVVARYPIQAEYQTRTTRRLPLVRLTPLVS